MFPWMLAAPLDVLLHLLCGDQFFEGHAGKLTLIEQHVHLPIACVAAPHRLAFGPTFDLGHDMVLVQPVNFFPANAALHLVCFLTNHF
jgi:hypothetical protein